MNMRSGMNAFLKDVDVTFRRDNDTNRPRINKPGSRLTGNRRNAGVLLLGLILAATKTQQPCSRSTSPHSAISQLVERSGEIVRAAVGVEGEEFLHLLGGVPPSPMTSPSASTTNRRTSCIVRSSFGPAQSFADNV